VSTQAEVQTKMQFIEDLLSKDRFASPADIISQVEKKFGSGVAKPEISKLRMEKFGIRFGPGGLAFDKDGKKVENPHGVARGRGTGNLSASKDASTARLSTLLSQLRNEMKNNNISELHIDGTGSVKAVQTVVRMLA
jgi:hypothetical protein